MRHEASDLPARSASRSQAPRTILEPEPDLDRRLKYPEAAKYCGISTRALQRLVAAGKGPKVIRLGYSRRFDLLDLRRWLAEHRA